jgi:hypothetical protein
MTFPASFLRGVPNPSFLLEDGSASTHLFHFEEERHRADGWIEQSINWEDNQSALELIFNQRKENGELQFKAGAVRIPREEIDRLSRRPTVAGMLGYERSPIENNPYHGNLLLRSSVPKPTMRKIAAGIALAVSDVIYRP